MHVSRLNFRRQLGTRPLALLLQCSSTLNISLCDESHLVSIVVLQVENEEVSSLLLSWKLLVPLTWSSKESMSVQYFSCWK
jgi:hypothetical protein